MHRARQHGIIVPVSAVVREVLCSLAADRINNPPADGLASPIARVSKLFPPVLRFLYPPRRRSASASDGAAPDANFLNHARQVIRAKVYVWLIRRASGPPAANQFHAAGKSAPKRQKPWEVSNRGMRSRIDD